MGVLLIQYVMLVDCDGILSLWVHSIILEEWESIEGGRVARGGELLFAGVVVSSPEEYDAQGEF